LNKESTEEQEEREKKELERERERDKRLLVGGGSSGKKKRPLTVTGHTSVNFPTDLGLHGTNYQHKLQSI